MLRLPAGEDFGNPSTAMSAGGFLLVVSRFGDCARAPKHAHERPYFGFPVTGSYVESYGSRSFEVTPRQLAFDPGATEHQTRYDALHAFRIEIEPAVLARAREVCGALREPAVFRDGPALALSRRIYAEARRADALSPLIVEGLGLELIGAASRAAVPDGAWIERVRERIDSDVAQPYSLADLAAAERVHPMHLARAFRKRFGCSAGEYLRARRIERAAELLRSDAPLADVALACGFASQSHFTTAFRLATGVTPAAFRRARGRRE